MTQFRIKLLVASVAAVAVAGSASAQAVRIGGNRGVTVGFGQPGYSGYNTGYGYANPGYGYGSQAYSNGFQYGSPYHNGFNSGYNNGFHNQGYTGNWNQGYNNTWNQGYNQGFQSQPYVASPGSNYFPATSGYGTQPQMTYSQPTQGFQQFQNMNGVAQTSGFSTQSSGVVQSGGFSYPQQMSVGVNQASMMSQGGNWSRDSIVSTQVLAPDGATVTLSGVQADRNSGARQFISPPLEAGKTYTYRARCTWTDDNGQQKVREKSVDVKAGQQVTIDLTRPDTDARSGDQGQTGDQNRSDDQNRTTEKSSRTEERNRTEERKSTTDQDRNE